MQASQQTSECASEGARPHEEVGAVTVQVTLRVSEENPQPLLANWSMERHSAMNLPSAARSLHYEASLRSELAGVVPLNQRASQITTSVVVEVTRNGITTGLNAQLDGPGMVQLTTRTATHVKVDEPPFGSGTTQSPLTAGDPNCESDQDDLPFLQNESDASLETNGAPAEVANNSEQSEEVSGHESAASGPEPVDTHLLLAFLSSPGSQIIADSQERGVSPISDLATGERLYSLTQAVRNDFDQTMVFTQGSDPRSDSETEPEGGDDIDSDGEGPLLVGTVMKYYGKRKA
ncbi:hypothetical protein K474DRAFT_1679964 [Panus rudis PR-1116 ss-1]|nr:hypothetical protein K474DRAFT_1679964 [Panus rudis PR-1116 ss-1]